MSESGAAPDTEPGARGAPSTSNNGPGSTEADSKRRTTLLRRVEVLLTFCGIITFAYFLFDLYYQAVPDIVVSSSETESPFSLPFSVKVQSIIFSMHDTIFKCSFKMTDIYKNDFMVDATVRGTLTIDRWNPGNYFCRNEIPAMRVVSLTANIHPVFCTQLFFWCWNREAPAEYFTWIKTSNGGYWVKGNIGNK